MNEFTQLRNEHFERNDPLTFQEYYLEKYSHDIALGCTMKYSLAKKIAYVRTLYRSTDIVEDQLIEVLNDLGENAYLDRYIVNLIVKNADCLSGERLSSKLRSMLEDRNCTPDRLCNLMDICIECNEHILDCGSIKNMLHRYVNDFDAVSILLDYMYHFNICEISDHLLVLLDEEYPENIRIQIMDSFIYLNQGKPDAVNTVRAKINSFRNNKLYSDYIDFITLGVSMNTGGLTIAQTMLYGDPDDCGKGQSGGLCTFLRTLGNHLTESQEVANVLTVTINNDWNDERPMLSRDFKNHWIIRLPLYLNTDNKLIFVKKERVIKRFIAKFMKKLNVNLDIFHIRYLDHASKSMASYAKDINSKLVFTLTPDPHRTMVDHQGRLKFFEMEEALEKLDRISIGDELLTMADGIIGIGGDAIRKELELNFPQLRHKKSNIYFEMIGEGIDSDAESHNFNDKEITEYLKYSLDDGFFENPIILNVGRLNRQKGQDKLMKAWGKSRLWKDYNLIIIGGNGEKPNSEEQYIVSFFNEYLESNEHLRGRFAHFDALPNKVVRGIERAIMNVQAGRYPNLYICSSQKEEFGISVLEALSERFLVFAPVDGGVKTYLNNGINGFLIDTSDWSAISEEVERVIYYSNRSIQDFMDIQKRGQQTVSGHFSMSEIAKDFLDFYLEIKEG